MRMPALPRAKKENKMQNSLWNSVRTIFFKKLTKKKTFARIPPRR